MICGHDRETLQWAIEYASRDIWQDNDGLAQFMGIMDRVDGPAEFDALHDVVNPAKLAAIIAERGQKLGFFVGIAADIHCRSPIFGAKSTDAKSIKVWVRPVANEPSRSTDCDLDMPQARAFALALLDAPNATAQDIERMIGEVTK